ncbi:MAG: hypothetical protein D6775_03760 [Caldilineae bacterium]|nr:MAG: hypothetical protein D6775_03760 [Caldilineae bacterium]
MSETDDLLTLTARTRTLALKCADNLQDWRRELAVKRLREALMALEEKPDRISADGALLINAPGANAAQETASQPLSGDLGAGRVDQRSEESALSALLSVPCMTRDPF